MHFRAARRRRRALRVFPPKRLIARECVAFYVGELRFEVVVDPDGPRDRMFFFLRRLPAQNVASQVRCAPAAGAARSSSPRATCGPTETPRPSMSSPWRYMSTDDDRALGKDANHVLWPWVRRFSPQRTVPYQTRLELFVRGILTEYNTIYLGNIIYT